MKLVKVRRNITAAAEDIYVLFFPIEHQHDIFMVTICMCLFEQKL